MPPYRSVKVQGWFFLHFFSCTTYRLIIYMKVSSASKNIPNCIKSLKLNLFFMCTTPILFGMKVKPPCNTIAPWLQCIIFSFILQCVFPIFCYAKLHLGMAVTTEYSDHRLLCPLSPRSVQGKYPCTV